MRKRIFLFVLSLITFHSSCLFAHEDVIIHPKITENAIKNSSIEEYLKNNLNFKEGFETILPSSGGKTILTWLKEGSTAEDALNICRASNHFLDPTKTWDTAGMSDSPWWINAVCNAWTPYYAAVTWATGLTTPTGTPIAYDTGNAKSPNMWGNARALYYNALTTAAKTDRESYFAQTFKAIGQVLHLIQDMSVNKETTA